MLVVIPIMVVFGGKALSDTQLSGYEKLEGQQCVGVGGFDSDLVRDFEGTVAECKEECDKYDNCAGFVRVNSGSQFAGKCYLRADGLQQPYDYSGDDRDCYRSG